MNISAPQWLVAITAAAGVHLLVFALAWWGGQARQTSTEAPRGIMVSLESFDAAPPPAAASTPVEPATPDSTVPSTPAPTAAPEPEAAGTAAAAIPEATADIGPLPADDPSVASSGTAVPVEPADAPTVAQAVTVRPSDVAESIEPGEQVTARAGIDDPSADRRSESSGASGSGSEATDDYIVRLRGWLSRYRQYPRGAQRDGLAGTVRLYVVIDDKGHIISHRIQRSSGSPVLDRAAEQMLRRAEPLPRMPAAMQRNRLELVVPVVFSLQ